MRMMLSSERVTVKRFHRSRSATPAPERIASLTNTAGNTVANAIMVPVQYPRRSLGTLT